MLFDFAIMNEFDRLFSLSGLSLDRLRTFLRVAEAGNLSKAAHGVVTKQSLYSRQIKELEAFFGVALTRRVGRRIEITPEGLRLADLIRRHFGELDDFREAMNGRPVCVRIGTQGSLIDWLLLPRLAACRDALGGALVELEQHRSADIVRGVADGRLDFGIVRDDAVPPEVKRWKLGKIGYALFAPKSVWKAGVTVEDVLRTVAVGELLPGGQYSTRWREWLATRDIEPRVAARMPSFVHLARMTREAGVAAVLPEIAGVDFDAKKIIGKPMPWKHDRQIVLIANPRSLDRSGIRPGAVEKLAGALRLG
jgi:DNA-binding transcriptional LysR family regulator